MSKVTLGFLLILVSFPTLSADFERGLAAIQNGDFATALREWTPLAEQGHADAQYHIGVMYVQGDGVQQDFKTALRWFTLAAEQGNASAQYNIGLMYHLGNGVTQDYDVALRWYNQASEQGDEFAQYNLGAMYFNGEGVLQDYVYAHMWFNIASSNGFEGAREGRERAVVQMTPADISKAQQLARECVTKNYKGC